MPIYTRLFCFWNDSISWKFKKRKMENGTEERRTTHTHTYLLVLGVSLLRSVSSEKQRRNKTRHKTDDRRKENRRTQFWSISISSKRRRSIRRNFPAARNIRETRRGVDFQSDRKRRGGPLRPSRKLWLFYAKQPNEKKYI
jgi:hypothetical protein